MAETFPGYVVTSWNAVVAPPKGNPREVAAQLRSESVGAVARAGLRCLKGKEDPAGWLAARLRTSVDEKRGTLTIRLVDCPKADAVTLLGALRRSGAR